MPIQTDGPLMEPENKGIDEFHVGYGATMRASAAQAWEDSPINQLIGINEMDRAAGKPQADYGELATGMPTPSNGLAVSENTQPAAANIDIIDANDRVKKAGLAPHLKLPDQPDIPPAQLAIMMDRAKRRAELDATIERGPGGFIQSALDTGTSFAVGAVDPLNVASAFIPVVGELRYGKILASAGDSLLTRAAVRAGTGAAEGVVGQAALEPLDWYSHTQDGRDFGMADVLQNLMFGAALGGGMHAGGGFISDAYRGARGRALYPFGPGEPMENVGGTHVPAGLLHEDGVDAAALHEHLGEMMQRPEEPPKPALMPSNEETEALIAKVESQLSPAKAPSDAKPESWFQDTSWKSDDLRALSGDDALYVDNPNVFEAPSTGRLVYVDPETGSRQKYSIGGAGQGHGFSDDSIGRSVTDKASFKVTSVDDVRAAVAQVGAENISAARKGAVENNLLTKAAPPSPAVQIINDLPQRAHEDAMRGAIASLIDGEPVRAGEMLEAASKTDPRIAESFDHATQPGLHLERDELSREASHFFTGEGDKVSYTIKGADGQPVGYAEFVIDGNVARILDVATDQFNGDREAYGQVRNSIGPRQMRELLDQFRELHPEVEKFTADRVSGARKGGGYDAGLKGNEIEVKLPKKNARGRAGADPQTWSLYEFLAHEGGLKPDQELQAIFGNHKGPFVPGFGALVRPGGRTLDDALRLAKDHGYLFDAADVTGAESHVAIRDLLDKVAEENSGRKQYRDDQQHTTKAADAAALERETHEVISALHDEIEATSGVKGSRIDPRLEQRVVEIITREGEHDVLAAYERAIMEDEERYNAETGHQAEPGQPVAGRHLPDDTGAAPDRGGAIADAGAAAGRAGPGAGADAGRQPRSGGAGDRAAPQAQLGTQADKDAAWRQLAQRAPEFDDPEVVAASKAADAVKPPPTKLDERVTAAEKADAFAKQMYDMFAHRLPEEDRVRLDDLIKRIEDDNEARETAIVRGGSCLFGVV